MTLKIKKTQAENNHSRTYSLCVSMLDELTDNNVLYGFNLDSTEIKERVDDLKDKKWNEKVCDNYIYTENYEALYLKISVTEFEKMLQKRE